MRKRAVFDQFGEEGLKHGVPTGSGTVANEAETSASDHMTINGAWTSGYTFHGDVEKVFREFFGGNNPFQGQLICNFYFDQVTRNDIIINTVLHIYFCLRFSTLVD